MITDVGGDGIDRSSLESWATVIRPRSSRGSSPTSPSPISSEREKTTTWRLPRRRTPSPRWGVTGGHPPAIATTCVASEPEGAPEHRRCAYAPLSSDPEPACDLVIVQSVGQPAQHSRQRAVIVIAPARAGASCVRDIGLAGFGGLTSCAGWRRRPPRDHVTSTRAASAAALQPPGRLRRAAGSQGRRAPAPGRRAARDHRRRVRRSAPPGAENRRAGPRRRPGRGRRAYAPRTPARGARAVADPNQQRRLSTAKILGSAVAGGAEGFVCSHGRRRASAGAMPAARAP